MTAMAAMTLFSCSSMSFLAVAVFMQMYQMYILQYCCRAPARRVNLRVRAESEVEKAAKNTAEKAGQAVSWITHVKCMLNATKKDMITQILKTILCLDVQLLSLQCMMSNLSRADTPSQQELVTMG